ncbi:MAG: hypothetical protein SVX38_13720 [Chloroflexota bacterium]|nr:hypothetical protein [Chloroflexota bacterium]
MAYKLETKEESDYALIRATGEMTPEMKGELSKALLDTCEAHPHGNLVIDVRDLGEPEAMWGELGSFWSHLRVAKRFGLKTAVIDDRENTSRRQFAESLAIKSICQVVVFPNVDQAEQWISSGASPTIRDLFEQQGPLAVLARYELDRILTDQDDPALWAAALIWHWPAPDDKGMYPDSLRFGVGHVVSGEEDREGAQAGDAMERTEVRCFERVDEEHLRVVECHDQPAPTISVLPGIGILPAARSYNYLDVSRPSKGERRALIHWGVSGGGFFGSGETRYWERQADGRWAETEETVSRWLS